MKIEKLTKPDLGDADDYCCGTDEGYRTFELRVPAIVIPQTSHDATTL